MSLENNIKNFKYLPRKLFIFHETIEGKVNMTLKFNLSYQRNQFPHLIIQISKELSGLCYE